MIEKSLEECMRDHPQGLSPEDRKEWHKLGDAILKLYAKIQVGDRERAVVSVGDRKGNVVIFFKGDPGDAERLTKELYRKKLKK